MAIVAAYVLLALLVGFGGLIFEKPRDCSAVSPLLVLARTSAIAATLAIIAYVAAYGRLKVLWLTPQILSVSLILIGIAFEPFSLPLYCGGICWVAV